MGGFFFCKQPNRPRWDLFFKHRNCAYNVHPTFFDCRCICVILSALVLTFELLINGNTNSKDNENSGTDSHIPDRERKDVKTRRHGLNDDGVTRSRFYDESGHDDESRHIGFVKVHKAASSTVQNILFRFGLKRNLTFVFTTNNNYFSTVSYRHFPLIPPRYRDGYDIHCIHGIFNHSMYSGILPKDTVYTAIVRDPLNVFISAVNYYTQTTLHLPYLKKITGNKLQKLIRNPEVYDANFFSYTKNVMARDMGFPATYSNTEVEKYLNNLDKIFKVVLIVEHFDESLILLRRHLHWNLQDILYMVNNVRIKNEWSVANLTADDVELFQSRNRLDVKVYNFFYKRFWQQFTAESPGILSEVLHFKTVLNKVLAFCKNQPLRPETKQTASSLKIPGSNWNQEFEVHSGACEQMEMAELEFIQLLRHEQGSDLNVRAQITKEGPDIKKRKGIFHRSRY